jgi:hypothetical protein
MLLKADLHKDTLFHFQIGEQTCQNRRLPGIDERSTNEKKSKSPSLTYLQLRLQRLPPLSSNLEHIHFSTHTAQRTKKKEGFVLGTSC